ncbi:MAG: Hpt domain-containing protein [Gammaproteobacteria bacterium]|nr:Hpt domain-containing protein [Gammaproteobacteria bacterium]MDH3409798.1 Hpt domain-containing protein [Gammaproteobacteria bacterium]
MSQDTDSPINVDDPFARRLLNQYLERRKSDLTRLRVALSQKDFSSIQLTGHNLFGSGAAYGLEEVSALGKKLEQAAKSIQADRISDLIDELERFVTTVTVA